MAWTFTTQVYLNKSEHIHRLGGPRRQGWEVGGGRQTYRRVRAESVWYERAAEGVAGGLGAVLGFGAGGKGPRVGESGARGSFSSLACSPPSP